MLSARGKLLSIQSNTFLHIVYKFAKELSHWKYAKSLGADSLSPSSPTTILAIVLHGDHR